MLGNKLMKRLSLYVFLILFTLQTPSLADDIGDLQIEGMSIGDSLLDYFSEEEIKKNYQKNWYNNKEFSTSTFKVKSDVYDSIQLSYRSKDKTYVIKGIEATKHYKYNIKDCYSKKNEVVKEILDVVTKVRKINNSTVKHKADKTGKSTIQEVLFKFKTGDQILIQCYDWSKEMKYNDHLRVGFRTNEFQSFLWYKAYK